MSKSNIDLLKGLFGEQVVELNEDQRAAVSSKLEKLIETRVEAKVKFQTEVIEAEAKEKYDVLMKEASAKYSKDIKAMETVVLEKAMNFKKSIENKSKVLLEKVKTKTTKDMEVFKEGIVEKLDKYLDLELDKKIPDVYVEAVAKVQILEPIVEGFKKTMQENYIKFDEENFSLIKDARAEIIKVREQLAESTKQNMDYKSKMKKFERSMKISEVCEGLTDTQRKRASKLLESYDADEIKDRFDSIRDLILENTNVEDKKGEEEVEEAIGDPTDAPAGDVKKGEEVMEDETEETVVAPKAEEKPDPLAEERKQVNEWAQIFRNKV